MAPARCGTEAGAYLCSADESLTSINHTFNITNFSALVNPMFVLMNAFGAPTPYGATASAPGRVSAQVISGKRSPSRMLAAHALSRTSASGSCRRVSRAALAVGVRGTESTQRA